MSRLLLPVLALWIASFSVTARAEILPAIPEKQPYGKSQGILGEGWVIGPSVSILALPRPLAFSLESKYDNRWGFAATYGLLPEVSVDSVKVKSHSLDFRARWFPYQGAFFVGLAFGKQNVTVSDTQNIQGTDVHGTEEIDSYFLTPHVGWEWVWKSGLFLGLDLGAQIPISNTESFSSDADAGAQSQSQYTDLVNTVNDKGKTFGKLPLPMITFLKIGWYF